MVRCLEVPKERSAPRGAPLLTPQVMDDAATPHLVITMGPGQEARQMLEPSGAVPRFRHNPTDLSTGEFR